MLTISNNTTHKVMPLGCEIELDVLDSHIGGLIECQDDWPRDAMVSRASSERVSRISQTKIWDTTYYAANQGCSAPDPLTDPPPSMRIFLPLMTQNVL